MNFKFPLTVLFLMSRIGILRATGQCHSAEYSVGGMHLRGHTFKTCQVGLPIECYFKCQEEVTCQSYNFVIGQNICELNNRTKEARPEDFLPDGKRFYMKRPRSRVPLGSKDLPAQSCTEIKASEGMKIVNGKKKFWQYHNGNGELIEAYCVEKWEKINGDKPVCFGARGNQYGAFNMTKSGRLMTMKLIHRTGSIHCNTETGESYWGCTHKAYGTKLSTIITNTNQENILPTDEDLEAFKSGHNCRTKHFYTIDGANHTSAELVFRNLSNPLHVSRNQELQIWFGQDWKDCSESENSGKTCVDVYAWYA